MSTVDRTLSAITDWSSTGHPVVGGSINAPIDDSLLVVTTHARRVIGRLHHKAWTAVTEKPVFARGLYLLIASERLAEATP